MNIIDKIVYTLSIIDIAILVLFIISVIKWSLLTSIIIFIIFLIIDVVVMFIEIGNACEVEDGDCNLQN